MAESGPLEASSILSSSSSILSIPQFPEDSDEIDDASTDSDVEKKKETRMRLQSIYGSLSECSGSYDSMLHLDYSKFKECVVCQKPITELLVWAMNKPHHCKCLTCFVCDKPVAFKKFKITEGKLFMCYKDYYESYQKCRICQKPTNNSGAPLPFDKLFHQDCFKCPYCFDPLQTETSVALFDEVYCNKCAVKITAKKQALRRHYQKLGRTVNDEQDTDIEKPKYALEEVPEELMAIVEKILSKK